MIEARTMPALCNDSLIVVRPANDRNTLRLKRSYYSQNVTFITTDLLNHLLRELRFCITIFLFQRGCRRDSFVFAEERYRMKKTA